MASIDREQELESLRKAVAELSMVNELARAISSTMSTPQINEMIIQKCIEHLGVEQGYISIFDEADRSGEMAKTLVRAVDQDGYYAPLRLGSALTAWIVKRREALMINDAQRDERFFGLEYQGITIDSVLAVPLQIKNRVIGFLSLFNKRTGKFSEEDKRLLSIIAQQSATVIESARLYQKEKELMFLQQELRAAGAIQQNLLPSVSPTVSGFDIAGRTIPAKETGGDYYDFIEINRRKTAIALADVVGKGLTAALIMSNVQPTLYSQIMTTGSVEECMEKTNQLLSARMETGKYVTMFYGVIDAKEKSFNYCNAGHNPPVLIRSDGQVEMLESTGTVLGMFGGMKYEAKKLNFASGDLLAVFSDGITEAQGQTGLRFEETRLIELLNKNKERTADYIIQSIFYSVKNFQEQKSQSDDMTLVVIKCN